MDQNKLILIIDDNVANGTYLCRACIRLFPDWIVVWIRPYHKPVNPLPVGLLPKEVEYFPNIVALKDAARLITEKLETVTDVLVFYDLQLGLLQRNSKAAQS